MPHYVHVFGLVCYIDTFLDKYLMVFIHSHTETLVDVLIHYYRKRYAISEHKCDVCVHNEAYSVIKSTRSIFLIVFDGYPLSACDKVLLGRKQKRFYVCLRHNEYRTPGGRTRRRLASGVFSLSVRRDTIHQSDNGNNAPEKSHLISRTGATGL